MPIQCLGLWAEVTRTVAGLPPANGKKNGKVRPKENTFDGEPAGLPFALRF